MQTHHSYLPFYYNSLEKQFLKGILVRKSHWIMIKSKIDGVFVTNGACVRKKATAKSRYLFLQKASS